MNYRDFWKQIIVCTGIFILLFSFAVPSYSENEASMNNNYVAVVENDVDQPPMSRKVKKFIEDLKDSESDDDTRHTAVWALGNLGGQQSSSLFNRSNLKLTTMKTLEALQLKRSEN